MDENRIVSSSQRTAARVAGLALLLGIVVIIVANYSVTFRLLVPNNAVETTRNISAHEFLFRVNVACDVLYFADLLVLLVALYIVLKPINPGVAMVAAAFRLALAFAWVLVACEMLGVLRLLGDTAYLSVFTTDQLHTLAMLHLSEARNAYYIGLPLWGLASMVGSFLWLKSKFIPKVLAAFGVVASAWCVFCGFGFIAVPHFDQTIDAWLFDVPLVIFELVLGLWLLIRGVRTAAPATFSPGMPRVESRPDAGADR